MTPLPDHESLPVHRLAAVFDDTTNSYKFYWFLAILDELQETGQPVMATSNLALRMVSRVWYPLDYFRLSFGRQDSFKSIAGFVSQRMRMDNGPRSAGLFTQLQAGLSPEDLNELHRKVTELLRWVPYRFVRPFVAKALRGIPDHQVNTRIVGLSQEQFDRNPQQVLYRFTGNTIEISPVWVAYLQRHQGILRAFVNWHLVRFLQKHNPNVTGLSEKLEKPTQRNLTDATKFWKAYLTAEPATRCIYSGQVVTTANLSLDHFLPWSFVAHDQLWNLVPVPKAVNSSKSDWLPSVELYANDFAGLQYRVFQYHYGQGNDRLLEDYCSLFAGSTATVSSLPQDRFMEQLTGLVLPQWQTARNLGFPHPYVFRPSGC